jgi:RNA polymerase sigma-70 factor (ECF subfamily)
MSYRTAMPQAVLWGPIEGNNHNGQPSGGSVICSLEGAGRMTAVSMKKVDQNQRPAEQPKAVPYEKIQRGDEGRAPMSEAQVDQLLVERVQKGDKTAFDLLINKYQHRIVSLVSRYVGDQAEALDVAQEAFIKAYRAIGKFRGDSAFYTWLYRIAINTAKNWLVAKKRRPPASDIDAADAEQYDIESRLKERGTPENEMMRDEIKQTVFRTISELPEDLRTAIMLREIEGMSYEDIATTMECPIGTVRSRIFRAREAIDEKLRPLIEGQ